MWKKYFFSLFFCNNLSLCCPFVRSFFVSNWVILYFRKYCLLYFCCFSFNISTISIIFYHLSSCPFFLHSWLFFPLPFFSYLSISIFHLQCLISFNFIIMSTDTWTEWKSIIKIDLFHNLHVFVFSTHSPLFFSLLFFSLHFCNSIS